MINVLDKDTINQISAGEVIERPASVIKELVENAIDAHATVICVEIRGGGIDLIRITDNGTGIDRDEVKTAFLPHATSKLKNASELCQIHSLGFRGEALPSIASVASVEMLTKTRSSFLGTRYCLCNSEETAFEEIGTPDGTTIIVRDLFKNVPVRRKFLKSATTEGSYCNDVLQKIALSHCGISIKFINNGRIEIFTNGNRELKSCCYTLFGREISSLLVEASHNMGSIDVKGYVAKPLVARSNRNFEYYFVNDRFIRNKAINKAIEDAYKPYLMQHKYPFTVLFITIDADEVDVNVHPTKQEVRFENSDTVYKAVYHAVTDALCDKTLIPNVFSDNATQEKAPVSTKEEPDRFYETPVFRPEEHNLFNGRVLGNDLSSKYDIEDNNKSSEIESDNKDNSTVTDTCIESTHKLNTLPEPEIIKPTQLVMDFQNYEIRNETKEDFKKGLNAEFNIIGQVFDTYWIISRGSEVFIVDQHAAHEKILYERIVKGVRDNVTDRQYLSPGIIVTLSTKEADTLSRNKDYIESMGFGVEPFGGNEYIIDSVPLQIYGLSPKELLLDIIADIENNRTCASTPARVGERLATYACKAAVKGNNKLSYEEGKALIEELLTAEDPFNCPHGRPIIISMTKEELEKKFKRIV